MLVVLVLGAEMSVSDDMLVYCFVRVNDMLNLVDGYIVLSYFSIKNCTVHECG